MLRWFTTSDNLAGGVRADTAFRSKAKKARLARESRISHNHRKKQEGRSMPKAAARANARKMAVRARGEHVFAYQKDRMGCSFVPSG